MFRRVRNQQSGIQEKHKTPTEKFFAAQEQLLPEMCYAQRVGRKDSKYSFFVESKWKYYDLYKNIATQQIFLNGG